MTTEYPVLRELAGFSLLREIGRGGVGTVFLARQESLGRLVAVKVLRGDLSEDEVYLGRFHREAQAAAIFQHPHVVSVIDAGKDDYSGDHFIAFEYIDGGSVEDLLRREGRLDERHALEISLCVGRALAFAESKGMLHRDVKPANILLARDGTAKLADLGLAKKRDPDQSAPEVTQEGVVVGTPYYMAPEQALGRKDLDGRADIYSLGLCLWRMLTGRTPFLEEGEEVSTIETISRRLSGSLPDVRSIQDTVSEGAARVLKAMSARRRHQRYARASDLVQDLERLLAGEAPLGPEGYAEEPDGGDTAAMPLSGRLPPPQATSLGDDQETVSVTPAPREPPEAAPAAPPGEAADREWLARLEASSRAGRPVLSAAVVGALLVGVGLGVLAVSVSGEDRRDHAAASPSADLPPDDLPPDDPAPTPSPEPAPSSPGASGTPADERPAVDPETTAPGDGGASQPEPTPAPRVAEAPDPEAAAPDGAPPADGGPAASEDGEVGAPAAGDPPEDATAAQPAGPEAPQATPPGADTAANPDGEAGAERDVDDGGDAPDPGDAPDEVGPPAPVEPRPAAAEVDVPLTPSRVQAVSRDLCADLPRGQEELRLLVEHGRWQGEKAGRRFVAAMRAAAQGLDAQRSEAAREEAWARLAQLLAEQLQEEPLEGELGEAVDRELERWRWFVRGARILRRAVADPRAQEQALEALDHLPSDYGAALNARLFLGLVERVDGHQRWMRLEQVRRDLVDHTRDVVRRLDGTALGLLLAREVQAVSWTLETMLADPRACLVSALASPRLDPLRAESAFLERRLLDVPRNAAHTDMPAWGLYLILAAPIEGGHRILVVVDGQPIEVGPTSVALADEPREVAWGGARRLFVEARPDGVLVRVPEAEPEEFHIERPEGPEASARFTVRVRGGAEIERLALVRIPPRTASARQGVRGDRMRRYLLGEKAPEEGR